MNNPKINSHHLVPSAKHKQPVDPKKKECLAKMPQPQPRLEVGLSSSSPSVLDEQVQFTQGVQIALTPE